MKCNIALKLHLLDSHQGFFSPYLGDVIDEHGESFHQDISVMVRGFVEKWNYGMLAEYCWATVRETTEIGFKRKRSRKIVEE